MLAAAQIDGKPLDEMEMAWMFFVLLGAGNDTTRTLITNATRLFLEQPGVWARLKADTTLLPQAIEEALRLEPSVRCMGRTATVDVELHGTTIRAGDPVFLWYCAGNRDPDVFPDPDRFDLDRNDPSRQQAFGGGGPHHCIGAPLARMQSRIIFEEFIRRMPDLAMDGAPVLARSDGFMNSLKHLPVRFSPGRRIDPARPG